MLFLACSLAIGDYFNRILFLDQGWDLPEDRGALLFAGKVSSVLNTRISKSSLKLLPAWSIHRR
jgi:hypothetical protein